jgi:hypothetical protein
LALAVRDFNEPRAELFTFPPDDGIVVVEVKKGNVMEVVDVAPALRGQLGTEGTVGLVELFETARQEWTAGVLTTAVERFERRLTEEISGLRLEVRQEMTTQVGALRQEITTQVGALRQEMTAQIGALREEMFDRDGALREEMLDQGSALRREIFDLGSALRQEMAQQGASLRVEINQQGALLRTDMGDLRFDLLKWAFVFWAGQTAVIATVVGVMLQLARP